MSNATHIADTFDAPWSAEDACTCDSDGCLSCLVESLAGPEPIDEEAEILCGQRDF